MKYDIDEIKEMVDRILVQHIIKETKALGYTNLIAMCSYINSTNSKYQKEAEAAIIWRDAIWEYCEQVQQDIMDGKREMPMGKVLISELPKPSWIK